MQIDFPPRANFWAIPQGAAIKEAMLNVDYNCEDPVNAVFRTLADFIRMKPASNLATLSTDPPVALISTRATSNVTIVVFSNTGEDLKMTPEAKLDARNLLSDLLAHHSDPPRTIMHYPADPAILTTLAPIVAPAATAVIAAARKTSPTCVFVTDVRNITAFCTFLQQHHLADLPADPARRDLVTYPVHAGTNAHSNNFVFLNFAQAADAARAIKQINATTYINFFKAQASTSSRNSLASAFHAHQGTDAPTATFAREPFQHSIQQPPATSLTVTPKIDSETTNASINSLLDNQYERICALISTVDARVTELFKATNAQFAAVDNAFNRHLAIQSVPPVPSPHVAPTPPTGPPPQRHQLLKIVGGLLLRGKHRHSSVGPAPFEQTFDSSSASSTPERSAKHGGTDGK